MKHRYVDQTTSSNSDSDQKISSTMLVLHPGFTLAVARLADQPEIWRMFQASFEKDALWTCIKKDVINHKEVHPWLLNSFSARWKMSDMTIFKITEDASGKIVAWTALQVPWKYVKSNMTEQLKAHAMSKELPEPIDGMNVDALGELFMCLRDSENFGYDPENDYHRRGTFVHPDFQNRGFGSVLTENCNNIADNTDDRTWVPARPSSIGMFKKLGFKVINVIDCHLERWGGTPEQSLNWTTLRSPPSSQD